MSKLVFKYMRYELHTEVPDVISWMTPSRINSIRRKLPDLPELKILDEDTFLLDTIVEIWRFCDCTFTRTCLVNARKPYQQYLIEVLNEFGLVTIIKRVTILYKVYDENERYEKDGVMYFPCELDYVYWLLDMPVHGNYIPVMGKLHPLFDSVEAFQDAILEGKSNWEFILFLRNNYNNSERLEKPAMVRYIKENGKRFEAYENAYDYAKRKKEER